MVTMTIHQWFVIALNIAAFLGMVTMFVVYGCKDVERGVERPDGTPVDYRQYRKI